MTRTMVKKKSADSDKSSCSVYIFLGESIGLFFWFVFLCLVAEKIGKMKSKFNYTNISTLK